MASTFTNLGVELMATGENAGTWGTKTNANLNLAEQLLGGFKIQTLNAAGSGANTTPLTIEDGGLTGAAQNRVIILGAVSPEAITGNKVVTFPLLTETFYFIKNSTSGAYTVQLKAESGSGGTVTFATDDKGYKLLYLDGVTTNTGVIEIPLGAAGDVTLTGVQTLTNKTLTSPKIGTNILDTNGNELAVLTATGSAVNEFTLANAASGNAPRLSTSGETNVDLDLLAKGTGLVTVRGNSNPGSIRLNCESNSHGIKLTSPAHSANQSYELKFPTGNVTADRFLKVDSVSGSGTTGVGQLSFSEVSGGIAWQSSIVTASTLAAASGNGYWINTTSNACTVTLPGSPSVGDEIVFTDYARKWSTNAVTFNLNSLKFQGSATPVPVYDTEGETVWIVYSGATQGWIPISDGAVANETPQSYTADFLVVAGGGGSSMVYGGGGGAGGYRNSFASETSGRGSSSETALTLSPGVSYTVTVGGGGAGAQNYGGSAPGNQGINGDNSVISGSGITTVTSLGGGGGAKNTSGGKTGGCGGGGGSAGNAGPGTAAQGYDGGQGGSGSGGPSGYSGGGGGGAGAVGVTSGSTSTTGVAGGAGLASSITGSSVTRGGGGGGGAPGSGSAGPGGSGGGGSADDGAANTGGGGGGTNFSVPATTAAHAGGKGVVILSVPDASYSGTTSGSPTVATGVSGKTVITFNGSGSYTG